MLHDSKIAIAVRSDLATWQKLNVTAFLASGIAAEMPEAIGEPYRDAGGVTYLRLFGLPVVVLAGDAATLSKAHRRALDRNLALGVYTNGMFSTGNDIDNRAVVAALPTGGLDLAGLAVFGDRRTVDKALKDLKLHP